MMCFSVSCLKADHPWQWCGARLLYEQLVFSPCGSTESEVQACTQSERERWPWSMVAAGSGRTCHLASPLPEKNNNIVCTQYGSPCEELSRPCHLNVIRGLANARRMTAPPLGSVCATAAREAVTWEAETTASPIPHILTNQSQAWQHLNNSNIEFILPKEATLSVMPHNSFCWIGFVDRNLSISTRHYLSLNWASLFPPEPPQWFPLAMPLSIDIALLIMI